MRRLLIVLAFAASCLASAQVRLKVEIDGRAAGFASLSQRLSPDGGKSVELKVELGEGKQKATVRSQSSYDAKGNPVRKFIETILPGKVQKQSIVTFSSKGAEVVLLDGGNRSKKEVSLVATAPRAMTSEFWFLRETPAKGASVESYSFNTDALAWVLTKTTYVGPKAIMVGGKSVTAHEVRSEFGDRKVTTFLDAKGLPLRIEDGRMRMTRVEGA